MGVRNEARERLSDADALRASGTKLRTSSGVTLPLDAHVASLATLAAGVACHVNDPLTSVLVSLEHVARRLRAMQAGDDDRDGDGFRATIASLSHAIDGARRVREAVRALMAFSGGASSERTEIDPKGILESALQIVAHELRASARLVVDLEAVPHVEANAARLAIAFRNVLANAAHATASARRACVVHIESRTDDGWALFEIRDDGVGIPQEALPHVFDPYFTTKRFGESFGLGLSIAHGIVTEIGGEIALESTEGAGTAVRIRLPPARRWTERRRVLVVDDDAQVASAVARALEADDDVTVANGSEAALRAIGAGEFDAIVCDLGLPEAGAIDLLAEIVRNAPQMLRRVVFVNDGGLTPKLRALVLGSSNPCVDKPVDAKRLRAAIAQAARR